MGKKNASSLLIANVIYLEHTWATVNRLCADFEAGVKPECESAKYVQKRTCINGSRELGLTLASNALICYQV